MRLTWVGPPCSHVSPCWERGGVTAQPNRHPSPTRCLPGGAAQLPTIVWLLRLNSSSIGNFANPGRSRFSTGLKRMLSRPIPASQRNDIESDARYCYRTSALGFGRLPRTLARASHAAVERSLLRPFAQSGALASRAPPGDRGA